MTLDTVSCRTAAIISVCAVEKDKVIFATKNFIFFLFITIPFDCIVTGGGLCSKNGTGEIGTDDTVVCVCNATETLNKACFSVIQRALIICTDGFKMRTEDVNKSVKSDMQDVTSHRSVAFIPQVRLGERP